MARNRDTHRDAFHKWKHVKQATENNEPMTTPHERPDIIGKLVLAFGPRLQAVSLNIEQGRPITADLRIVVDDAELDELFGKPSNEKAHEAATTAPTQAESVE